MSDASASLYRGSIGDPGVKRSIEGVQIVHIDVEHFVPFFEKLLDVRACMRRRPF